MQSRFSRGSWLPGGHSLDVVIYVDGSSVPNPGPSGFGLLVLARGDETDWLFGHVKNIGLSGNNQAEFLGLIEACELVRSVRPRSALIVSDSTVGLQLATGKIRGGSSQTRQLQQRAATWLRREPSVSLCWVPRSRNLAHHLAREAADLPAGTEATSPLG
ncbi:MAG: RNase H family protein, partial [Chloroflexota bacterium]